MFGSNKELPQLAPPLDTPYTLEELKKYDGSSPDAPIYLAVKGVVFDVTPRREMYGPGSGYHIFTGKDASRALATSSLKAEDCIANIDGITAEEMETLNKWYDFFSKRYNTVGRIVE
ncbi:cytochrome b5 [Basidiobolus meristosporus CBS 931.73]|uniref:Cytochrome b5 n=1 Tax=Basidiobolus meristosporus CBS 931.73 TaxID=1314790 RepID=A0A1Y1XVV3_9FUNG|nr:cytochrome b5 [Basidiobolus meristosporus CBS 931.73]|eukprot:ORX89616.1 cytochrome b5 [Basidiobolus meristosporus CBS 931.73]